MAGNTTELKKGFTLIELIFVILLIGIIGIIIVPKISFAPFRKEADITRLYSDLRFTQQKSIISGGNWKIAFDGNNKKYTIYDQNGDIANLPSGDNPVTLKSEFTSSVNEVYFDYLGRPDNDSISSNNNLINSEITITINDKTITVVPYSGGIKIE